MAFKEQSFSACTSVLVGKKASIDGSIMIARNEDAKTAWPKHFFVYNSKQNDTEQIFTSLDNGFTMKLPQNSARYTATPEWTNKYGVFAEDGFNEYGVAMSATESAYANERVLGVDPLVSSGIGEEAMVTVTLPYIHSAREGVAYLGNIISQKGASESNGILFADQKECWYMEIATGHHWVAQRIPDDSYAVVANQLAIQEIDFTDAVNFMFSPNIENFVSQNHLNVDHNGFNFRKIFGTQDLSDSIYSTPRVWYGQKYLNPEIHQDPMSQELPFIRKASQKISREDVEFILASHFQGTDYDPIGQGPENLKHKFRPISLAKTQESHILQIRPNFPSEIAGIQWLSMGVTAQSVFVPFYSSICDTPESYKIGTDTYSFKSAYWKYKLLGVLVDSNYLQFGEKLKAMQKEVRIELNNRVKKIDNQVLAKEVQENVRDFITAASIDNSLYAIKQVEDLTAQLITEATAFSPLNFKTDANL
ncbi:C69 family dipeptidase [Liquorilactobacillus cacaonum]|uniref:Dipeptidase n=1 Tax=Liquorilactobacillus cacaonum DSM 21116 TaxID=1423729 RepID=A0A0R2CLQ6_9LACO|nr:C69 family dipeptidase [Liquorilactobacillus cacaonum]KRM90884.1 Dipeptidase [Liquorilactobacillus cacaonum DSM 21116]